MSRSAEGVKRKRALAAAAVLALALLAPGAWAAEGAADGATSPTVAPVVDVGAKLFLSRCAGCHTVGGGQMSGPDLLLSTRWPQADLWQGIKRMESKAGPLKDEAIDSLAELLRSGKAQERLAEQQAQMAAASRATLQAPSPRAGAALFHGTRSLRNGGPSCVACHAVGGIGGNLGPDLTTVSTRVGETALRAGIEQASFLVMKPIYDARPIEAQEALHLTAYLQEVAQQAAPRRSEFPVPGAAAVAAGALLGLLGLVGRRRADGTRKRLVQKANMR